MKVLSQITFFALLMLATIFSSCSKCYECKGVRVYNNVQDTVSEDICTADQKEIDAKEAAGYTCAAN